MPAEKKISTKLKLPTEINQPSDDFLDYLVLLFGRKNIGKSTLGATFPDSINFQFERGRRNLPIRMLPLATEPPLHFKSFSAYWDAFCEDSEVRHATIDTIDAWYDMIYRHVCLTHDMDEASGPEVWNEIKHTVDDFIAQAQDAEKSILFISHERTTKRDNADGTTLERLEPSCTNQALTVVQRYCDFVFHYDWCTNDRVITIRNRDNSIWTSCGRDDRFLDPDGNPLYRVQISDQASAGFTTLSQAWEGELRDYDYVPPKPKPAPMKSGSVSSQKKGK